MEDINYTLNVLRALLYLSSQDSEFVLPTINDAISSEIVNGAISYIGGSAGECSFVVKDNPEYYFRYRNRLWRYFEKELEVNGKRLNPKIKDALTLLVEKGHGEGGLRCLDLFLCNHQELLPGMKSSTSLPYKTVMQIQRKVLPSFSETERKDLEGIANSMKPFIEEDLKYIKEHYYW